MSDPGLPEGSEKSSSTPKNGGMAPDGPGSVAGLFADRVPYDTFKPYHVKRNPGLVGVSGAAANDEGQPPGDRHHCILRALGSDFFPMGGAPHSLESTPFAHLPLLKAEPPLIQPLELEEFHCLLLACRPPGETDVKTEWATARNQAILWVLADTGMLVSEVSGLHLSDVNQESGILTVKEKGPQQRQLPLGPDELHALRWYLDQRRPEIMEDGDRRDVSEEPLFL